MRQRRIERAQKQKIPAISSGDLFHRSVKLLHRFSRILELALSGLDDRTIDLAGAHGDAGEADFVQAADRVDIATVFTSDEDFELRIDGAGVSDEGAVHLLDGGMTADERMTLEEFLVDVERQEVVGVVAGNGECRLCEVVCTEGCESVGGVAIVVVAGDFDAEGGDDFAGGDGGSGSFDHGTQSVRDGEALFFFDLRGDFDGDFADRGDFGGDNHERDFDFGFRMFTFLNEFGGGIQDGLNLHLGDFGVRNGHTDRTVTEHRVFFLFEPAVVGEELVERRVEQTNGHAIAVHLTYPPAALRLSPLPLHFGEGRGISAVFEVILRELIDGIEGFLGFGFVIAKQNFLNVRQTVAEEHVLGAEEADAAGALVECRKRLGGFSVGADVEGLDFLAPVENRLSGFFELGRNGHGDFAEINFAGRAVKRDVVTTFYGVAVAAEGAGGFVDRDFGGTDDGGDALR